VAPQPLRVLPVAASVVAMGDWDDLFSAISGRLTAIADAGAAIGFRAGVLECVEAMGQLQTILTHERACNHQLELELFHARAALAQARIELVASRSDERRQRRLAMHDELTSLPNRSFFGEWIDHALVQAEPQQVGFAVLYLDLDGFKLINDAYGHDVGDELLRIVASRLARAVRAEDVVSRLGGDEFACLMINLPDREQLSHLACKLFDAVSAPVKIGPHALAVRPSIGISMCPDDGTTAEALLRHADAAMYHAKRNGSGYAFFEPGIQV
jgi:diguanylate cyclase